MTKIKPRARFFYYEEVDSALAYQELASSYVHPLNGTWQFCYLASPREIPEAFNRGDYESVSWESIQVPGHMELQGYGQPNYTNIDFPIPVMPATVPAENPTGLYYRKFNYEARLPRQVLRFDGVDSLFKVWVNGRYVGEGHGSRLMSEFEITEFLRNGENTIAVEVDKWSQYSYLEDQDMWWLSGIFRDVSIVEESMIENVQITPTFVQQEWQIQVNLTETSELFKPVVLDIYDGNKRLTTVTLTTPRTKIPIANGKEWNNEEPHLYTAIFKESETATCLPIRFGLRSVEMINNQICLNGVPVLFNGVNRHEFDPNYGRTLSRESIYAEVVQIKQNHINAIRTSHYPNIPYFYDVCDELGVMVIDECDIETHGMWVQVHPAEDSYWESEFIERGQRMVQRDFNHPCILIWSLGNESGFGPNFVAMAESIRQSDPSRLIHYEGDRETVVADMYSTMYTGIEELEKRAAKAVHQKPQILCEYGHAMGNGPGSLKDYQDIFRLYPALQGGFIWEWKNHGLKQRTSTGEKYVWGGAFDEAVNDGTFCIDGLVRPDGLPSPGLLEYAQVIQPIQFYCTRNQVVLKNLYHYRTVSTVSLNWQLQVAGAVMAAGQVEVPPFEAGQLSAIMTLDLPNMVASDAYLNLSIVTSQPFDVFEVGDVIAREQKPYQSPPVTTKELVKVYETSALVTIQQGKNQLVIDRGTGNIKQIIHEGQSLLSRELALTLDRLPISNEINAIAEWEQARLATLFYLCESLQISQTETAAFVLIRQRIMPPVVAWGMELEVAIWLNAAGITVETKGWFDGNKPQEVPRIGYQAALKEPIASIEWYGRGENESYPDSFEAAPMGRYHLNREKWAFPYIVPQEAGNRMAVRWAELTLVSQETRLRLDTLTPLNLNIVGSDGQPLNQSEGPDEIRLDVGVQALGSNSCGPLPLERYRLYTEPFEFTFTLGFK